MLYALGTNPLQLLLLLLLLQARWAAIQKQHALADARGGWYESGYESGKQQQEAVQRGQQYVAAQEGRLPVQGQEGLLPVPSQEEQRTVLGEVEQPTVAGQEGRLPVPDHEEQLPVPGHEEQLPVAGKEEQRTVAGKEEQPPVAATVLSPPAAALELPAPGRPWEVADGRVDALVVQGHEVLGGGAGPAPAVNGGAWDEEGLGRSAAAAAPSLQAQAQATAGAALVGAVLQQQQQQQQPGAGREPAQDEGLCVWDGGAGGAVQVAAGEHGLAQPDSPVALSLTGHAPAAAAVPGRRGAGAAGLGGSSSPIARDGDVAPAAAGSGTGQGGRLAVVLVAGLVACASAAACLVVQAGQARISGARVLPTPQQAARAAVHAAHAAGAGARLLYGAAAQVAAASGSADAMLQLQGLAAVAGSGARAAPATLRWCGQRMCMGMAWGAGRAARLHAVQLQPFAERAASWAGATARTAAEFLGSACGACVAAWGAAGPWLQDAGGRCLEVATQVACMVGPQLQAGSLAAVRAAHTLAHGVVAARAAALPHLSSAADMVLDAAAAAVLALGLAEERAGEEEEGEEEGSRDVFGGQQQGGSSGAAMQAAAGGGMGRVLRLRSGVPVPGQGSGGSGQAPGVTPGALAYALACARSHARCACMCACMCAESRQVRLHVRSHMRGVARCACMCPESRQVRLRMRSHMRGVARCACVCACMCPESRQVRLHMRSHMRGVTRCACACMCPESRQVRSGVTPGVLACALPSALRINMCATERESVCVCAAAQVNQGAMPPTKVWLHAVGVCIHAVLQLSLSSRCDGHAWFDACRGMLAHTHP